MCVRGHLRERAINSFSRARMDHRRSAHARARRRCSAVASSSRTAWSSPTEEGTSASSLAPCMPCCSAICSAWRSAAARCSLACTMALLRWSSTCIRSIFNASASRCRLATASCLRSASRSAAATSRSASSRESADVIPDPDTLARWSSCSSLSSVAASALPGEGGGLLQRLEPTDDDGALPRTGLGAKTSNAGLHMSASVSTAARLVRRRPSSPRLVGAEVCRASLARTRW